MHTDNYIKTYWNVGQSFKILQARKKRGQAVFTGRSENHALIRYFARETKLGGEASFMKKLLTTPSLLLVTLLVVAPAASLRAATNTQTSPATTSATQSDNARGRVRANVESTQTPETERTKIQWQGAKKIAPSLNTTPKQVEPGAPTVRTAALSGNLIPNPSVEAAGSGGLPASWKKGGYGSNTRTLTYPVTGSSGSGIRVQVSNYQAGDAKWYFTHIPIHAGTAYRFSDLYQSSVPSIVTAQFQLANGSYVYKDIASLAPAASFAPMTVEFVAPSNAVALTIFHLIKSNGTLTTDDYDLREVTQGGGANYVPNGTLETGSATPDSWRQGRWGQNTTTFSYPVTGSGGGKAARVTLTNKVTGDAKWFFNPIALSPGTYTFQDEYTASISSHVTVQIQHTNGTVTYQDIAHPPASPSWSSAVASFTVPQTATLVTIFHLINQNGTLTIDNMSITGGSARPGIFQTGAVTLRFDDNWDSQYTRGFPKLNSRGLKGVLYVVSRQIDELGFPGYMTRAQIEEVYNQGHEIGAHTRTHRDLASLSYTEQQNEVAGSRQDLLGWDVGTVDSFAYPFGSYTTQTLQVVADANFESAASSNGGLVTPTSDPYQLERRGLENTTAFEQARQWIDEAIASKNWLILTIHDIQPSCADRYCVSMAVFNQIVDYLADQNTPVVTVKQAFDSLE